MRSFYSILIIHFCMLFNQLNAQQPCNDEAILNKKGGWKKHIDANMWKGDQSQVQSRIDKMQKILQAAYPNPKSIEASWYRSMYSYPLIKNGSLPYELTAMLKIYYCLSENEMVLGDETSTWFYVYANYFGWFMEYDRNFTVKKNPVYLLTKKVGEISGYPIYEGIHNGTSNTGTYYSRAIIISRPGQSPYQPVTRRQYLRLFLKRYEIEKSSALSWVEKQPVRSEVEEEAYKQKELEKIEKSTPADKVERQKSRFLSYYVTDKQNHEILLKKTIKRFEDAMKPAQDLLNTMSEEQAEMPAIVGIAYAYGFKKFLTEEEDGRMLVRLNPDYFDSKLPKYVPQFLVVYWRWQKNKYSENFKKEVEANFKFEALKDMLDK